MEDLIKALKIFLKYRNEKYPTICIHDQLIIVGIEEFEVSEEDTNELNNLGFNWSNEHEAWSSYRYGSA